jgi:purine nucleosidase
MKPRLIIDTDIGTDVDDLWTLAMLPGLSDVQLDAITLVYGDTRARAQLAVTACDAMGLKAPIHRGCEKPLSDKEILWAGYEGTGVPDITETSYSATHAVDALITQAAQSPNTLDVVAIGPLTNIATAIQRHSPFAHTLHHISVMGGEFKVGWPEHNFSSDVIATKIVLESGIAMTIMPLDQTLRLVLNRSDVEAIASAHPIGPLMAAEAEKFWRWLTVIVPSATGNSSAAHDPAALLALVEPTLFEFKPMHVEISEKGQVRGVPDTSSPIQVVTDFDVNAVRSRLLTLLGVTEGL